jgi:hypothetical protein
MELKEYIKVGTADDAATAEADCFLRTKEYRKY